MDYALINHPLITVLMSVYNGESFLAEAIDSILSQTFTDLEFLIIDDGSTDSSPSILVNYAQKDCRIRIIRNPTNIGLTKSLNEGLDLAQGQYIARMDADEVSLPDRLEKQFLFMQNRPEIGVCGTNYFANGATIKLPCDHEEIACGLIWNNTLAHPTTIFRRSVVIKNNLRYDERYCYAQDYAFWFRCAKNTRLANLPEPLLVRREHANQISTSSSNEQALAARRIREHIVRELGVAPTKSELKLHDKISSELYECGKPYVKSASTWLSKLRQANNSAAVFPEPAFSEHLCNRWFSICKQASALGIWTLLAFYQNDLSRNHLLALHDRRDLIFRCLARKGYWRTLLHRQLII
ncbi:MAG: glycosyltransferase family 2 protein [Desulfomonilia bacterium]|jgi:hypothetical protein